MSKKTSAPEGAMSVDQAVAQLTSRPKFAPPPAAAGDDPDTDDCIQPANDCADDPDCDPDGDGPASALKPPRWWDAEDQAWFVSLDPQAQGKILKQEAKREAVLHKARAATDQATQQARAQTASVEALAQGLSQFLPRALGTFRNRWQGIDWVQLAGRARPVHYQRLRAAYEAEQGHLQRLSAAQQQAGAAARNAYTLRERTALVDHAPALADRQDGVKRQAELKRYLKHAGASDARVSGLSALEVGMAHKAMLYDRAQQGLSRSNPRTPGSPTSEATIRPAAGGAPNPQRSAHGVRSRFAQSRSIDDAVALLNMTG